MRDRIVRLKNYHWIKPRGVARWLGSVFGLQCTGQAKYGPGSLMHCTLNLGHTGECRCEERFGFTARKAVMP